MATSQPPSPTTPPADPYGEYDPIPQPNVSERSTDTTWQLWEEVKEKETARYADTVPMTVPGAVAKRPAAGGTQPVPRAAPAGSTGADKLMEECRRNNRVCPQPEQWQQLDSLLREKVPGAAATLARPLPANEWGATTALAKRSIFRMVTDWAVANGATQDALQFVRSLPEAHWHHLGE